MPTCPACGQENPEGFRFCGSCGASLETPPPGEERKVVTVLFVDLVGFTSRADRADPEDVRAILRPYHALLRREIDRWGGTLERFVGDAAMAVFGAPVAREDDPERAVRAALRILEELPDLNREHGLDLEVRAGIATGEALVTLGARPEAGEGIVAGDVVNTAARLQAAAPVGAIVVGEGTYRATREAIDFQALEPIRLKGKAEPVPAWRVLGARSRFGTDLEQPRTPFVGRDDDLAVLQQAYRRAVRERSLQLVTVTGEPGVGKTRLVTELRRWVDDRPEIVSWRQGRCLPYGEGVAFWAIGEIVKAQAGILESDGPEAARRKLGEAVEAVVEDPRDRGWLLGALGPLVGLGGDQGLDRGESFGAWRTFLEAVAQARPLVLVIEDLHWADEGLLGFLEETLDRTTDVPLLVLCTARPELYDRHPSWGGGKRNSTTVALSPLSDEETARLVAAILDQAVLPAETQRVLLEQAGGNPLYAEEFTKMLVDRGTLSRDGGTWAIREGAAIPVPETVHAIIAARLDTLTPDRKALLQDAAVVGKVFWSGALASMAGTDESAVREAMHELARKELVREARRSSVEGQAEYAFWHALVRDVAYGQIPRAARIGKHRAAAAWIERLAGDRVADVAELLAHHLGSALELAVASGLEAEAAELREQARRVFVLAGDRVRYLDERRAAGYYRRALELTPEGHPEHPEILVRWSDAASDVGLIGFDEARRGFERAIEAFRARGDHRRAADAMARYSFPLWVRGEGARALDLARRAVELLEREGPSHDLASAWASLAPRLFFARQTRASLEAAERALELCRELDLPALAARALQVRGMARCDLNDLWGLEDLREALRAVRDLGLGAQPTTTAHINLSWWVWLTEGPLPAIRLHREAIAAWERRGLGTHVWVTGELCWLLFDAGRWDELLEAAATVLDEEERAGDAWQPGTMALTMRSFVDAHRGRATEALARVSELAARARRVEDSQILVPALTACAVVEHRGGRGAIGTLAELVERWPGLEPTWRAHHLADL
ncbi:MAG TPA: adenylate/guanylate cyclase domain-containing protein, partial [Actinomycetota bacterium]|nr:adenylate/guanylate cyclase domain-containing protein [Actinomycetota bacterium]